MKNFFVVEDFYGAAAFLELDDVVTIANAKLAREIEKWPVVEGYPTNATEVSSEHHLKWDMDKNTRSTHTARLAFIEPIAKAECKHEPQLGTILSAGILFTPICRHCGVKLKMPTEWKEE